mmetsp:Transcript_22612/g.70197  ORF Transcript_22612/g.70197 Transcript_22612/m.70197 type:complete len:266 (-) Transcript_22612:138-935(-)
MRPLMFLAAREPARFRGRTKEPSLRAAMEEERGAPVAVVDSGPRFILLAGRTSTSPPASATSDSSALINMLSLPRGRGSGPSILPSGGGTRLPLSFPSSRLPRGRRGKVLPLSSTLSLLPRARGRFTLIPSDSTLPRAYLIPLFLRGVRDRVEAFGPRGPRADCIRDRLPPKPYLFCEVVSVGLGGREHVFGAREVGGVECRVLPPQASSSHVIGGCEERLHRPLILGRHLKGVEHVLVGGEEAMRGRGRLVALHESLGGAAKLV